MAFRWALVPDEPEAGCASRAGPWLDPRPLGRHGRHHATTNEPGPGHFALTGLLIDRLLAAEGSRVVTVSSMGHRIRAAIHFDDLQSVRGYDRTAAYGQAKLANLLFTYELQRRLAAAGATTTAVAAHPGVAATELGRNAQVPVRIGMRLLTPLMQGPDAGALPTLRAATDPRVRGGQYYGPSGIGEVRGHPVVVTSSPDSHDVAVQARLWTVSEELTGATFPALIGRR